MNGDLHSLNCLPDLVYLSDSVNLSACLWGSVNLSACLPVFLYVCLVLSMCHDSLTILSVKRQTVCLSCLSGSVNLSVCLPVFLPVCLVQYTECVSMSCPVYLYVCLLLFAYLYVWSYISVHIYIFLSIFVSAPVFPGAHRQVDNTQTSH